MANDGNPYLDVPLAYSEDELPSVLASTTAGLGTLGLVLATGQRRQPVGLGAGLLSFALSAGMYHAYPRVRLWLLLRRRKAQLRLLADKARARRDARRATFRRTMLMKDARREAEICALDAAQLLAAQRARRYSCAEVVRAFCSRALRTTMLTNNVTVEAYDDAMAQAERVDALRARPGHDVAAEPLLLGLPFSVKDHMDLQGFDSTAGAAVKTFAPAAKDSALVALLKRAGAIPFAKTNVPQSLMINESVNGVYGRALNPWNLARTVGGSSGGEGGLIGADASPCGIGSDIGGSIRGPAIYCGVCGLKPSPGRLTKVGCSGARWQGRDGQEAIKSVVGPMGRTVEDLALMMRAWLVQAQRDEFDFDVETHPKFDELEYGSTRKLRIGFVDHDEFFPACASSRRAVKEAVEALRARGHVLVPLRTANSTGADQPYGTSLSPETDPLLHPEDAALPGIGDIFGLYARLIGADGQMRTMRKGIQGEALMPEYEFQYRMSSLIPDWLRPGLAWALRGLMGERYTRLGVLTPRSHTTGYQLWESVADRVAYRKRFDAVWRAHKLDALVSIGMPYPAHKHSMFSKVIAGNSWMMWANCLEYVSGAVPVSVVTEAEANDPDGYDAGPHKGDPWDKATRANVAGSAGLPVGCQILAPPGKEELVLRVMREVEGGVKFREQHAPNGMGQGVPTARL
jgi:fatty acid amide hydrolase